MASATVMISEYSFGAADSNSNLYALMGSTTLYSACGQTFQTRFDGANVTSAVFWFERIGIINNTAEVSAYIYGTTGTYGSTSVANSTLFATSDPVKCDSIGLTVEAHTFTFSTPYALTAGETYALILGISTVGDMSTSKKLYYHQDSAGTHPGNYFLPSAGGWQAYNVPDLPFELYGDNGSPVVYQGGNTYISNYTTVLNSTVEATVSTGDVNIGGVTAEFNNTAVTAGDIAGGTYNMTLTGDVYGEGGGLPTTYIYTLFVFLFICLNLGVGYISKGFLIPATIGIISISIAVATLFTAIYAEILFSPWTQLMLLVMAIFNLFEVIRSRNK